MDESEVQRNIRAIVEAIILVVDYPMTTVQLAKIIEVAEHEIAEVMYSWQRELDQRLSGMQLRLSDEGWRLVTRVSYAPYVERALGKRARLKLSRSAVETLAIVAYKQPVTRTEVSQIRGVNSDAMIRSLMLKGLIEVDSEYEGAHRYITTREFLTKLGIADLHQLPPLAPLLPEIELLDEIVAEFKET